MVEDYNDVHNNLRESKTFTWKGNYFIILIDVYNNLK